MKLVLDAQQDFIKQSAANEPSFAASKKDGEFQLNFQFGDFVTKLKEIASSFKNNLSDGPLAKALSANPADVDNGNFLSGFLEGLGLEDLAGKYEENRGVERQKEEYVKRFMDENPAAQVLSPETARAAAEEDFRMLREGTMPQGTQTVEPMEKEVVLEQAEAQKQQVELDKQLGIDVADLKAVSEENLPFLKEIRDISEDMLLQLQIIAQNAGGGGFAIPTGGADKKPKPGRAPKGRVGTILEKSKGLFQGFGTGFSKLAAPLTVGLGGYEIYSNEKAVDAGTMTREEATKENTKTVAGTAAGLGTAKAAAAASLPFAPLAGPAAPLVPIVAGIAGFFMGDAAARLVTDSIMSEANDGSMNLAGTMDTMDPESAIFAAPLNSTVPVTSASNQLNKQTASGAVEIQQTTQNNVSSPTTVINNNTNVRKSPVNDEPTFGRYTQQRAYP